MLNNDINDIFGQEVIQVKEDEVKIPALTPFDYLSSINHTKQDIMVDDRAEKQYIPFIINKGLSYSHDTVIMANEMNRLPFLDKKLQYSFLINSIRPKKRFNKWIKAEKVEALDIIKSYYGYSTEKARQVLSILSTEQLQEIKTAMYRGGLNER